MPRNERVEVDPDRTVKVIMPDEAERRNIITKSELKVAVDALAYYQLQQLFRKRHGLAADAQRKIERVLAGMR